MCRLRSIGFRIIASYIVVVSTATIIVWLVLLLAITVIWPYKIQPGDYQGLALLEAGSWVLNMPDGLPLTPGLPPGFAVVVGPDNRVLHSYGDTSCRVGKALAECAPEVLDRPTGARFIDLKGEQWAETILPVSSGERVIARFGPSQVELQLYTPFGIIYGNGPYIAFMATATTILSIPIALLLAWLLIRPLLARMRKIAQASQSFAAGELKTRVSDKHPDEVGEMARQFDGMADTLEQNVVILRDLVQRNAELSNQAEEAAIRAERVRLSRDLHDDIAQRIFSLSVSSAALPATIERDPAQAVAQAQAIASLAEQTLLELRGLLVELRPSQVVQRGLAEALKNLCENWSATNCIPVNCAILLKGSRLPASIEDAIYRIAQESLNNIAKHAQAKAVYVSLVQGQRQITLSTTDDGLGLVHAVGSPNSSSNGHKDNNKDGNQAKFGLISMRERAQAIGGSLAIESDTAQGTTVRLTLPLESDENL